MAMRGHAHALRPPVAWLLVALLPLAATATEHVRLEDGHLQVEVAPALGGRIVHVSLPGKPNLLRVGEAVGTTPAPVPDADGANIAYLGHELWTGPQSRWWLDQDVNPGRRDAAAPWPPDPWLAHARNAVREQSPHQLLLEGVASPVSGLQVTQSYRLSGTTPATLTLSAVAMNTRDREVRRDLWFNTRVPATFRVFVPVARRADARLRADAGEGYAGPVGWWEDGLYSLQLEPPPAGTTGRRGKAFVAPSAGWIAAFGHGQLLLIRFDRQPDGVIDPEHGQVELYLDWRSDDPGAGLLELEVHAPVRTLVPGASMRAGETWTVLPYDGPDEREAQRVALEAALQGLVPALPP